MKRITVSSTVFFVALLMVSTSSVIQYVNSKPIIKIIENQESKLPGDSNNYEKEYDDLVLRLRELVTDEEINNLKSTITKEYIRNKLDENTFWDKISIKISIKKFEPEALKIKKLLENGADRSEIITEFHEIIKTVEKGLDYTCETHFSSFLFSITSIIIRIIGLFLLLVGLLMLFLGPGAVSVIAILACIDGILEGRNLDVILFNIIGATIDYFSWCGAVIFLGEYMFLHGEIPY